MLSVQLVRTPSWEMGSCDAAEFESVTPRSGVPPWETSRRGAACDPGCGAACDPGVECRYAVTVRVLEMLNPERRGRRWAIKAAVVGVVALFTMYPNPVLLVRHVARALDLNGLIAPEAPGVAELEARVRTRVAGWGHRGEASAAEWTPAEHASVLMAVNMEVVKRLPYEFDWDNWGCANYFPTAAEALERGVSDCKGRAVVAASVLTRLGYTPRLVSDLSHVWVWTKEGETMSPVATASGRRVVTADERGSRVDARAILSSGGLLRDVPARLGYAVSVFPPMRTGIIAAAVWAVLLRRRPSWMHAAIGAAAMAGGLVTLWLNCGDVETTVMAAAWGGVGLVVGGMGVVRVGGRDAGMGGRGDAGR